MDWNASTVIKETRKAQAPEQVRNKEHYRLVRKVKLTDHLS